MLPHPAEIKLFASTVAMARMASDRCADILINKAKLDELQDEFQVGPADQTDFNGEVAFVQGLAAKAFAAAPSPQAWCDGVYRMYGPNAS